MLIRIDVESRSCTSSGRYPVLSMVTRVAVGALRLTSVVPKMPNSPAFGGPQRMYALVNTVLPVSGPGPPSASFSNLGRKPTAHCAEVALNDWPVNWVTGVEPPEVLES